MDVLWDLSHAAVIYLCLSALLPPIIFYQRQSGLGGCQLLFKPGSHEGSSR